MKTDLHDVDRDQFRSAYKRFLIDAANANGAIIAGDFAKVRAIVDRNELVFAVWQDKAEPDGVASMVVKGEGLLREIAKANRSRDVAMTAIPCVCAEQAEALRRVIAEPDIKH